MKMKFILILASSRDYVDVSVLSNRLYCQSGVIESNASSAPLHLYRGCSLRSLVRFKYACNENSCGSSDLFAFLVNTPYRSPSVTTIRLQFFTFRAGFSTCWNADKHEEFFFFASMTTDKRSSLRGRPEKSAISTLFHSMAILCGVNPSARRWYDEVIYRFVFGRRLIPAVIQVCDTN